MNLLVSLRAEILKTRRTASFYLALVAGATGPLTSLLELIFDGVQAGDRSVILTKMFTTKFQMTAFLMLPMFIMLICTLLPQIEYKNNTWKQVLTSPQAKGNVFLAKFLSVHLLILVFLAANQLVMFAAAVVLHFLEPSLNVLGQPLNGYAALMTVVNSYLTLLAIGAIQFWMGLRFKNFIVPIAVGISLWFIGALMVMQFASRAALFFPYSFHVYSSFPKYGPQLPAVQWASFGYAALFLVAGFADFKRRRMNG